MEVYPKNGQEAIVLINSFSSAVQPDAWPTQAQPYADAHKLNFWLFLALDSE